MCLLSIRDMFLKGKKKVNFASRQSALSSPETEYLLLDDLK